RRPASTHSRNMHIVGRRRTVTRFLGRLMEHNCGIVMPITWPFFMFMIRLDANRQPGREVTNDVEGRSANLDWMWAERPSRNPTGPRPAECWAHEWSPAPTAPETRNRRRVKKSSRTIAASFSRPRVVAAVELAELPAQRSPGPVPSALFSAVPTALLSSRRQNLADGLQEALHTDRLRLVAVEASGHDLAAILRHRGGCYRDDRDRAGHRIGAQPLQRLDPAHPRQLDVHQDQGRPLFSGHAHTILRGLRLEG